MGESKSVILAVLDGDKTYRNIETVQKVLDGKPLSPADTVRLVDVMAVLRSIQVQACCRRH